VSRRGADAGDPGGEAPWLEPLAIIAITSAVSALAIAFDLDQILARRVFDPGRPGMRGFTNQLSSYSILAALLGVGGLCVPALRRRWPFVARCIGVFAGTLVIAVLAIVMNLKSELDRPRPNEVVEFGGEYSYRWPFAYADCGCKSFPSSAAAFGYLVATPFFVLRRRSPRVAVAFLVVGLAWGSYIGYGRMVANMHWLTDIVWSAGLVLATASLLARIDLSWRGAETG